MNYCYKPSVNSRKKGLQRHTLPLDRILLKMMDLSAGAKKRVELAQLHGYPAQICNKCPRKRQTSRNNSGLGEPQQGYTPCDYYEQFIPARRASVVLGVHNHMTEWFYDLAGVSGRTLTVIDESPLSALAKEVKPIDAATLALIRHGLKMEIERLEAGIQQARKTLKITPRRMFTLAGYIVHIEEDFMEPLRALKLLDDLFAGRQLHYWFVVARKDQALGLWIDLARKISLESGLAAEKGLDERWAHLALPFPYNDAMRLLEVGRQYDPSRPSFIPNPLPPNKTIILDATASKEVYDSAIEAYAGKERPYEFKRHPLVEQPYCHTVQVVNASYGVGRLEEEKTRKQIAEVIRGLRLRHPGPALFVCHQAHKAAWIKEFAEDHLLEFEHFGALRGLNKWADYPSQFIVGTQFVPDHAVATLGQKFGLEIDVKDLEAVTSPQKIVSVKR
ncbi:hypothetical protein D3C72_1222300 [compost metagenome]